MTLPLVLRIDKQRPNVPGHGVRDGKSEHLPVNFHHPPASVTLDGLQVVRLRQSPGGESVLLHRGPDALHRAYVAALRPSKQSSHLKNGYRNRWPDDGTRGSFRDKRRSVEA